MKYQCETCNAITGQVYGNKVQNTFKYQCMKCTFPPKKK